MNDIIDLMEMLLRDLSEAMSTCTKELAEILRMTLAGIQPPFIEYPTDRP